MSLLRGFVVLDGFRESKCSGYTESEMLIQRLTCKLRILTSIDSDECLVCLKKIQIIQISNPKDPKCENQIVIDWLGYNQFKYKTNEKKHKYDKITIFI